MEQISSFFSSQLFSNLVFIIKIILIVFSSILSVAIVVLLFKTEWLRFRFFEDYTEFFASRPFGTKEHFKKIESVHKKLKSGKESEYKIAVMEVDDFFKEILVKMNYKGETLDAILGQINSKVLPSIEEIKEAHAVRNNIVRNPDYHLTEDQAVNIVKIYEKALGELEMF
jgi:hypothetical protein